MAVSYANGKMFSALILCGFCAFADASLRQMALPMYAPPSRDAMPSEYFQPEPGEGVAGSPGGNGTGHRKEMPDGSVAASNAVGDNLWANLLKRFLRDSREATTHRYPTATWTAEHHEKLKRTLKGQPGKTTEAFLMKRPPAARAETRSKRGRMKWKGSRDKPSRGDEADKFLQKSLLRYLVSSKLIENIGNVSVDTFSEILRNVTRSGADKRRLAPSGESKDLRLRFRDEVFMRRKSEKPSRGSFLEKQLRRRWERMQDYLKGKFEDGGWWERNSVAVRGKDAAENRTEKTAEPGKSDGQAEPQELKLSAAETIYYNKKPFSLRSLLAEEEETGVIPGIPRVDYPMYSSPPRTGFRCPEGIGEQPRMMADAQTRCQVFYICTGDGPAAAMLCPNGTMFNENVRVCDWWYNVDC